MSKKKTVSELNQHQINATTKLSTFISSLIASGNPLLQSKADKLSYWLEDWTTFLEYEPSFSATKLRRYKRGEIVKVHLGFNIGSEEGGLHYAVVVEKNNAKSSPVVTVVPLTSIKPTTNLERLHSGNVFLGNELFTSLSSKFSLANKHIQSELVLLSELVTVTKTSSQAESAQITEKINSLNYELELLERMRSEVAKMKKGSIALVNQITTISKIRIYDPKTDHDILSGVKLSNEKLDAIDKEIIAKYTKG